ncbi:MAG: hypothetical protein ACPHID_02790 [Thermoplasmatota archaeon]
MNRKSARTYLGLGASGIALGMFLDVLFGDAPVATTLAMVLLVAGVVVFLVGLTWFIRNPMRRHP